MNDTFYSLVAAKIERDPEDAVEVLSRLSDAGLMRIVSSGLFAERCNHNTMKIVSGILMVSAGRISKHHRDRAKLGDIGAIEHVIDMIAEDTKLALRDEISISIIEQFNSQFEETAV